MDEEHKRADLAVRAALGRVVSDRERGELASLIHALTAGQIDRRSFFRGCAAIGLPALTAFTLMSASKWTAVSQAAAAESVPGARHGGVLRAAYSTDPAGFDPAVPTSGMSHVVIEQIFSTVMSLDHEARPYPDLAESFDISEDGLRYTFKLRKGVKFHNGDDLTAEDVKFTFDRLRKPETGYPYATQVQTIESVEAPDDHAVIFHLSQRTGPFLVYLAFPGSSIVPKKLVESGHDLNAQPIGSGPFKFVRYKPKNVVEMVRNDAFYEADKPYFDALEMRIVSDQTALTNSLRTGVNNFSNQVAPKDWAALEAHPDLATQAIAGSRWHWMLTNTSKKPLDDPAVRRAIAYAIDRKSITDAVFFGLADPILGGIIPKWNWAYAPDTQVLPPSGDPEKARKILAEAGYTEPIELTYTVSSSMPILVDMAPLIQANLLAAGFRIKLDSVEIPRYWDVVWSGGNYELSTMFWLSPMADPDDFVGLNYRCDSPMNPQKFCSEEMDRLLHEANTAPTQEARAEIYEKVQELSLEQMPLVPLVNAYVLNAYSNKLKNYKPMRTGFLKTLKNAYLEA
jgi:peptide/nickel transport system substrate-binding protein